MGISDGPAAIFQRERFRGPGSFYLVDPPSHHRASRVVLGILSVLGSREGKRSWRIALMRFYFYRPFWRCHTSLPSPSISHMVTTNCKGAWEMQSSCLPRSNFKKKSLVSTLQSLHSTRWGNPETDHSIRQNL